MANGPWSLEGLVLLCLSAAALAKISDYITPCHVKDPNLNQCVVQQAQRFYEMLSNKGFREYGLPATEGLAIPKMTLRQAGGIDLVLTDSKHYGYRTVKFESANVDPKNFKIQLHLKCDYYTIAGTFDINGRILVFPITGHGPSNLTMYNMNVTYTMIGKPVKRDGKTYMDLTSFKLDNKAKRATFDFASLFGKENVISETLSRVVEENNQVLLDEFSKPVTEAAGELYKAIAKKIFDVVPYEEIFPGFSE